MLIAAQTNKLGYIGEDTGFSMQNLEFGAQQGYMPKIMGLVTDAGGQSVIIDEWASNAGYTRGNVICVPLRLPKFLDRLGSVALSDQIKKIYTELFSVHPLTIDGLDSSVTLETASHKVGANEEQQEFVKATRAKSVPVFTFQEKLGKPVQGFLDFLISYGIMDPDTQSALIAGIGKDQGAKNAQRASFRRELYTPDFKTGSFMFIELDILNVNVVDAWYMVNMAPLSSGDRKGKKDLSAARELVQYSITMTGMQVVGSPVMRFAQNLVDNMDVFTRLPEDGNIKFDETQLTPIINERDAIDAFEHTEGINDRYWAADETSVATAAGFALNGESLDSVRGL